MKFPFTFDLASVFRLVIPGFFLAIALDPAIGVAFYAIGVAKPTEVYYAFGTVVLGWLFSLLDMQIYMLYEGRRFWPSYLVRCGRVREQRRLHRLNKLYKEAKAATNPTTLPVEYAIRRALFPLDKDGMRYVAYPTRLGNLIAEYEQYPDRKYGMDGVFYWYRVWFVVPKDIRDELTQQQSLADSSLYMSMVLFLSTLLFVVYALASALGLAQISPELKFCWLYAAMFSLICGYGFYVMALNAHSAYASFFKAIFDDFYEKVDVRPLLSTLAKRTGIKEYGFLEGTEAYKAAWRYLRWHKLRIPGQKDNVNAEQLFVAENDGASNERKHEN